jgi:3-oxoacyl-(acyl-carrier-protein) synthase
VEAVATVNALRAAQAPPTLNLEEPDPECDLDYVPDGPREAPGLQAVLSNSVGFGGQNATLVLTGA